jgi:HEAT repeat protein
LDALRSKLEGWRKALARPIPAALSLVILGSSFCHADEAQDKVQKLIQDLGSSTKQVRRDAAMNLGKMGPAAKEAVPALIKALNDQDRQVGENAVAAFADLGPVGIDAIPALIDGMGGGNRGGRRRFDGRQQYVVHAAYALSRMGPNAIPPLVKALSNDDFSRREGAAIALGDMGPSAHEAIPALIADLGVDDNDLQHSASDALVQIGPESVKPLIEALSAQTARTRQGAALALAGLGKTAKEAGPKLAELAEKETDNGARIAALGSLGRVGVETGRSVPLLVQALRSNDEALRRAAVNGLALVRPAKDAVPALETLLVDSDPAVRERAAHALSRLGSQAAPAAAALVACAKAAPDDTVFTEALSQVGDAALPLLVKELTAPGGPEVRRDWVFRALRDMGSSAMPTLTAGLSSPSSPVRAAAARALGDLPIQSPSLVKTLTGMAADADPDVRAAALHTLATIRTEREATIPKLEAALQDPAPQVRKTASASLVSLGAITKISVSGLIDLMDDPDQTSQVAAVRALGDLGPAGSAAVPQLTERLNNAALQSAIIDTLGKIGPKAEASVPRLLELARGKDREIQIVSMLALGLIGKPSGDVLSTLYTYQKNDDREVRYAAFQAITKLEPDQDKLFPVLLSALQEESIRMHRIAAVALAKYGDKAQPAVPTLIKMLDRETDRKIALEALKSIHVHDLPPLLTALNNKDANVRAFACDSLGDLGPAAKEAVPALQEKANGDAEAVRDAAKKALERINSNPQS